jgi:hypothetical protein
VTPPNALETLSRDRRGTRFSKTAANETPKSEYRNPKNS